MPIKKASMKDVRKSKKRYERNVAWKSRMKKQEKKVRDLIAAGNKSALLPELNALVKLWDRMAGKKLMHKNTAARKKSRIIKQANKLPAKAA